MENKIRNLKGTNQPVGSTISRENAIPIRNLKGTNENAGDVTAQSREAMPIRNLKQSNESAGISIAQPSEAMPIRNLKASRTSFNIPTTSSSRIVQLRVEPFRFLNFTKWECVQELNEHGVMKISGLISEDDALSYYSMAANECWVRAIGFNEEGNETTLMHGVMTDFAIQSDKEVHHMTIEVRTGSFLLDRIPFLRSFQRDSLQYGEVFDACVGAEGGRFIMREHRSLPIHQLLVQYHETTWAFAKRLAYKLGLVLLPEPRRDGKRLYIGLDDSGGVQEIISNDFTMSVAAPEQEDLIWREGGIYQVRSREVYPLGQQVSFMGRGLRIGKVVSFLNREELWHEYTLYVPRPVFTSESLNDKVRGVSLLAMVTSVERDRVRVSIHDDVNKHLSGDRLFDYATVYSTPDGTGWYCMPEVGDEVRLVFPEADERRAYVASSVHLATRGGRVNPDHKSWRNRQNKEILFTPDSLVLRNNQGLSIELSDNNGISIISDTGISLQSDQGIQINSQNANITMAAGNNISMSQGTAAISMSDSIDISGGKINMN